MAWKYLGPQLVKDIKTYIRSKEMGVSTARHLFGVSESQIQLVLRRKSFQLKLRMEHFMKIVTILEKHPTDYFVWVEDAEDNRPGQDPDDGVHLAHLVYDVKKTHRKFGSKSGLH